MINFFSPRGAGACIRGKCFGQRPPYCAHSHRRGSIQHQKNSHYVPQRQSRWELSSISRSPEERKGVFDYGPKGHLSLLGPSVCVCACDEGRILGRSNLPPSALGVRKNSAEGRWSLSHSSSPPPSAHTLGRFNSIAHTKKCCGREKNGIAKWNRTKWMCESIKAAKPHTWRGCAEMQARKSFALTRSWRMRV